MPSVKRKLAELEKERSKIKKTNHSIASFMVSRESVVEAQVQAELPLPTTEPQNNNEPLSTSSITTNSTETDLAMQTTVKSMPWQPSTPSQQRKTVKAKHKVGFDPKWNDTRPWLHLTQEETDNGTISVMYCKLCQKHQTKGRNGSVIWNKKGCATLRLDKVVDHEVSEMHKTAIRIETEIQLDIETAMRKDRLPMGENEFKAVTCATKILHFLIMHNIPHTTVFKDLVDFATKELKCPDLQHLQKGKIATYTSNSIADEFIDAMVTDIEETLVDRVRQSPGYAVMNDETTDKTNKKHLAFCVKYIDKDTGETCVNYLKDVRIDDGKAETIFRETERVISDVSKDKFVAYASDGCNTMVGKKTGVATRLKEMKPEMKKFCLRA